MRVALFNALIGLAGGGEKVALSLVKAFEELGHRVTLYTYEDEKRSVDEAINLLGGYRPSTIVVLQQPVIVKVLGIGGRFVRYRRLLLVKYFLDIIGRNRHLYDLVVDTSSNVPTAVDISYIHYPVILSKGYSTIYWMAYDYLVSQLASKVVGNTRLVLTNSSWTASQFKKVFGTRYRVEVLHPAVDVDYFSKCDSDKEDIIVCVSRYTPEKGLEKLVRPISKLENFKFYYVGSTHEYSSEVIKAIEDEIRRCGATNIEILTNLSRDRLREVLCRAKYYVHPPYPEHFGISVVEAMASGCVPIVYKDGGAWTDIVSKVDERLGYDTVDGIPPLINILEQNKEVREAVREKARQQAQKYSYEEFRNKLKQLLEILH